MQDSIKKLDDIFRFNEDSSSVVRHAQGECAVLLTSFKSPENLKPIEFTCNKCSQCCKCTNGLPHTHISSSGSVYRKRTSNDRPLDNPKHFRITQSNNTVQLAIDHVQREDAGVYTLYARTKTGETARRDIELIVEDRSSGEDPPIFLRRLSDLSVKVGTRTRLLVEIRSSTDVKTTWYRNDRRICENDRIRSVNEGNFHCIEIAPVSLEDGGCWMVQAENLGGRNSCLALISVLVPKAYKAPEFIEALRAVLTEQGTVSLECKVIGVPTPNLRWFKDSKEIKAGDVFALTANPDDPTSLGTYTCEAVNCMGKVYSSSKVHVVGRGSREGSLKPADNLLHNSPPPIFTNELKNQSIRIGETVMHGCQVVVPPWPKSVVWYNKEGRIDHNEKYRLIEDGLGAYMLEVKPSEFCDEGEWKCVVTSNEGSVGISTCFVTMDIPKNYRKPRFMESLKAVLTDEGLVSFECKVVGAPTPVLRWEKDGEELRPGDIYQLTGTNSLGTYCCIAKNCMGETSSTALLTLEDIQNQLSDEEKLMLTKLNQPPKFLQGLKSQEAKINEEFKFSVLVTATTSDPPLISWYRDELPIETSERYVINRESAASCHLEIRRVEFVDQAEWKCVAINDFGSSVTSSFLKLQIPKHYKKPRFLECLRAVMSDEGIVNLECKVIGVPQPVLKWFKDGVPLLPGDIHRIISGQDGTCCLGTYTCEARNCMGVVASSASLLGFDNPPQKAPPQDVEIQRNLSLSTINEERTSQMYDTPAGDITIDEKGDVSFSFDGKEVSVSLYETPDLTEEEALQIVEMYADQISEHVTEHNIVELPPLRFVKETQQSGNLLMEAVVIDVDPDYFTHVEDLRTEADMDDISIMEVSLHGLSSLREESVGLDKQTEEYVQKTLSSMENSLQLKRRTDSLDQDEYFSMSHSKNSRGDSPRGADDTESDIQTFASASGSAHTSNKYEIENVATIRSKNIEKAIQDTEKLLTREANFEFDESSEREPRKRNISDTEGSKSREEEAILRDISGEEGDGLKLKQVPSRDVITDPGVIQQNLSALIPLAISVNVIHKLFDAVEEEVAMQSALMMSPASAGGSLKIIHSLSAPLKNFERKLNVYSGHSSLENLFSSLLDNLKDFHQALSLVEKCVSMDEEGHTLVQRTSVCVVDSAGDPILKALSEIKQIVSTFKQGRLRNELSLIIDDMNSAIQITQDTIKSQSLMQEASELEAAQHFTDTIVRLQEGVHETIPFEQVSNAALPPEADQLKNVCRPVVKMQQALESIEHDLSLEEGEGSLFSKVHETILEKLSQPIKDLQLEICKIEKSIDTVVKDSLQEKISIAILDTVCPPMYELQKGLHVLSQQSSSNTQTGMVSVNVLDSMIPPLQEIQNGLARLGQDVESGSLERDSPTDNLDANRLLQSFAQSVLYLQNNIDSLNENAPQELRSSMLTLKNYLSKLIETVVEFGMGRYNMTILENIRKPVDDLNYCLRQIEERSVSGSMKDLIEPMVAFKEKAKRCEDIVMLIGRGNNDPCLKVLKNIQTTISTIEKEIEKNELTREQKRKPVYETIAILDQLQECIASIREQDPLDQAVTLTDHDDIALVKSLAQPLEDVKKCLLEIREVTTFDSIKQLSDSGDLEALKKIAQPLQDVVDSLKIVTQEQIVDPLRSMSSAEPMSELKHIAQPLQELHNCIALIQHDTQTMDAAMSLASYVEPSLKVARPLTELQNCIGKILQHICEPLEDTSTMDDISALKTNADVAAEYADNVVETLEPVAAEYVSNANIQELQIDRTKANTLIEELKKCLITVQDQLVFENVENIPSKREAISAVTKPIHELEKCLALIQNHDVHEAVESMSTQTNLSSLKTLLEPLQVLDMNIANIQMKECLTETQTLQNLAATVADLQAYITEQTQDMTESYGHMTEAQSNTAQDLQRCIASINHPNIMEALESLSTQTDLSDLKTLVKPIQELQRCLEIHENVCVHEAKDLSSQENLSLIKIIANPLLELKQSIATIEMQTKLDVFDLLSQHEGVQQTAKPVLEFLESVNNINVETLEYLCDLSQDDVSALKTWASLKSSAKYSVADFAIVEPKVSRENLATSLDNLNKCMETLQRQPSIESKDYCDENHLVLEAVAQPLEQVKQALLTIQEDENVNLEQILDSVTAPLLTLKETIQHLQAKLQNQELAEPITDLQSRLDSTLENIAEASSVNVVRTLLQRPKTEIQICLKSIENAPLVHKVHIDVVAQPLSSLETSIEQLQQSILTQSNDLIRRSNPDLQQFIAETQQLESQLYFIQNDILKQGTPFAGQISECILNLKTQIAQVENTLQEGEIVHQLIVAQAIQSFAVPVQNLSDLIKQVTVEPALTVEEDVTHIQSNIQVMKELSQYCPLHYAVVEPLVKLEQGILLIQQLVERSNVQEKQELLVNNIKESLSAVIQLIDSFGGESESLTISLIDVKDQIVQMERTLNDSKDQLLAVEHAKKIAQNIEKLSPLIENISKKLPMEEIIVAFKGPNKTIDALIETIRSKNLDIIEKPLVKLQVSMKQLESLVLQDPLQGLPKSKKEIKELTAALKETVKVLSDNLSGEEISEQTINLLNKLTKIQDICKQNVTVNPLQLSKLLSQLSEPLQKINSIIDSINTCQNEDRDTGTVTESSEKEDKELVSAVADIIETTITDDHTESSNKETNVLEKVFENLTENISSVDNKITENLEGQDIQHIKDKLEMEAKELLRKSEERELTPEEKDSLMTLLAKINSLSSEVKDDTETHEELKKNANFENVSGDLLGNITEKHDVEIDESIELIGTKKIVKISGETSIGKEEVKLVARLDQEIEENENYVKDKREGDQLKIIANVDQSEEIESQTLFLTEKLTTIEGDKEPTNVDFVDAKIVDENVEIEVDSTDILENIAVRLGNTVDVINALVSKVQENPRFALIDLRVIAQPLTDLEKLIKSLDQQLATERVKEINRSHPAVKKLVESLPGIESQLYFIHADLLKSKSQEAKYLSICIASLKSQLANIQTNVQDSEILPFDKIAEMIETITTPVKQIMEIITSLTSDSAYTALDATVKDMKLKVEEIKKLSLVYSDADLLISPVEGMKNAVQCIQGLVIAEIAGPVDENQILELQEALSSVQVQLNNSKDNFTENVSLLMRDVVDNITKVRVDVMKAPKLSTSEEIITQINEIKTALTDICKKLPGEAIIATLTEPREGVELILETVTKYNIKELIEPFGSLKNAMAQFQDFVILEPIKPIPKNTTEIKELTSSMKEIVKSLMSVFPNCPNDEISEQTLNFLDKIGNIQSFIQRNISVDSFELSKLISTIANPLKEIHNCIVKEHTPRDTFESVTDVAIEEEITATVEITESLHEEANKSTENIDEIAIANTTEDTQMETATEILAPKVSQLPAEPQQPKPLESIALAVAVAQPEEISESVTDEVKIEETKKIVASEESQLSGEAQQAEAFESTSPEVAVAQSQKISESATDKTKIEETKEFAAAEESQLPEEAQQIQ
ncbi:Muscle M-line assembly protein unc-89, partial [Pseudolycoriella hygida]